MSTNFIFFNMLLQKSVKKRMRKSEVLKKALVFYTICEYSDVNTLYEIKYVCKKFMELIKSKDCLDNKTLRVQISRMKATRVYF